MNERWTYGIGKTGSQGTTITPRCVRHDEFCALLISRRPLERCDNRVGGIRGLVDRTTGERFVIRDHDLFRADVL